MPYRPALDPDVAAAKTALREQLEATGLPEATIRALSSAIATYGAAIARAERRSHGHKTGETPAAKTGIPDFLKQALKF
jgi:hypothetical protein